MKRGTTLLELTVSLALLGILTGLLGPGFSAFRDRAAVLEARERLAALLIDARRVAVDRGGSLVIVRSDPPEAVLLAGGDTVRTVRWPISPAAPRIVVGAGRASIELSFDRAGLGRFASATVEFSRGRTSSSLVISSYGRTRRR